MREELRGKMYVGLVCPGFVKTDIFRNQTHKQSKLVQKVSMKCDNACKKIVRAIKKNKTRHVVGIDAKFMDFCYRHFPKTSLRFFKWILKKSKIELFEDVFK